MALSAHGYFGTLDLTSNTNIYDYSPYLFMKPKPGGDIRLWPLIKKIEDLNDTTARWYEDSLIPIRVTADTTGLTIADAQTTLTLVAGQTAAGFIKVGDLLRDVAASKDEIVQVTAITGEALTITRAYGETDTSNATTGDRHVHAASAVWEVCGHLNSEGSTIGAGEAKNLTERTNYTSILDQVVAMTRSQMRRRMQPNGGDPWDFQVQANLLKFQRVLERHLIYSRGVARASTPVTGSMAGIFDIIQDRAGSNISTAAKQFSYEEFDDVMATMWANGYEDASYVFVVPAAGAQYMPYIHESAMRMPYGSDTTRGMKATHLMSTFGHTVPVLASSAIPTDSAMLLNLGLITLRFMDTMLAYDVELGSQGTDGKKRRFISEFSLEMHNADTAHYLWQTGLEFTRP